MSGSATADPPCASAQGKKESQDDFTVAMTNMIPNSGPSSATPRSFWHVPVPRPRQQRFTRFRESHSPGASSLVSPYPLVTPSTLKNVLLLRRHPVILKSASFRSPRTDPFPNPSPAHLLRLPKSHDANLDILPHPKPPPPGRHVRPKPPPFTPTTGARIPRSAHRLRVWPRPRTARPDR